MRVLLCTSNAPGAVFIRWMTHSDWSHAALVSDDGWAIEATWPEVRKCRVEEIMAKHTRHILVDLYCKAPVRAWKAAEEQVGKPYDMTALFGWLSGRNWQEDDQWFCSELVAWVFEQGGSPLFRDGSCHRVTPNDLWMVRP